LIIAVGLFALVMAGVAAMTGTVVRAQTRLLGGAVLGNAATLARRASAVALESATFVATPGPGEISAALTAWSNLEDDGLTTMVPGVPARYAHECVSADGSFLHLYTGTAPLPAIVCGDEAPGARHLVVAGGPRFSISARFYRPEENADLVQTDIALAMTKDGVESDAAVRTEAVIRHANR
jgi:hypothetical protein